MRRLHHNVIGLERIQVVHQLRPGAFLDRLAAVVTEAQMDRRLAFFGNGAKHLVDRRRRPLPFVRVARQIRLVELHDVGIQVLDLLGEHIGDGVRQLLGILVVPVVQRLREHVRTGERELERLRRERLGARARQLEIQRSRADRPFDHSRRARAEAHARAARVIEPFGEADVGAHAGHRPHEVLDHAVGLGMIDVEAVELAVAHEVDAGALLRRDHHARRIDQRLLRRRARQPVRQRIGADHGGENARHGARL